MFAPILLTIVLLMHASMNESLQSAATKLAVRVNQLMEGDTVTGAPDDNRPAKARPHPVQRQNYSTQIFGSDSDAWAPEKATGEPDVVNVGTDDGNAWASETQDDDDEWLMLTYKEAVVPKTIVIHETYNPGAVERVTAFGADGKEVELWKGDDPVSGLEAHGVCKLTIQTTMKTNKLKIYVASTKVAGWNEIDAVGMIDAAGKTHWASEAAASSTYARPTGRSYQEPPKNPYQPVQATGAPNTTRKDGAAHATAWSTGPQDGESDQWLELEYTEAMIPRTVIVHETSKPGGMYRVTFFKSDGEEVEVWKGTDPTSATESQGISRVSVSPDFETRKIRLYFHPSRPLDWNEVDAVGLADEKERAIWATEARASSYYGEVYEEIILRRLNKLEQQILELRKIIEKMQK